MGRMQRYLIYILIIAAAAVAGWWMLRPQALPVAVHTVGTGLVEETVANTRAGTVNACRRAKLAPVIGGQIATLPVREGDKVSTEQILLELWNKDLVAGVQLSEREARAAAARAEEACVTADVAQSEAARLTKLRQQNLSSVEDTERAIGNARAKRAACEAAHAMTSVAAARVDVSRAALERTRLRAPFDGTIAEVNGELGEVVTPSPIGIPTLPAVDIIDNTCLYITAPIDEVDAPSIVAGMPARISLDAFPGKPFPGTVRRVAPYVLDVEKQARTVDIEADFNELNGNRSQLLPGYSADVEVVLDTREAVLRIPTEALLDNKRVLLLVDGTIESRDIKTGLSNWRFTEVTDGLKPGDIIITSIDREGVAAGAHAVAETSNRP